MFTPAAALLLALAPAWAAAAEQRCILEGVGVVVIDDARWSFTTTRQGKTLIHTLAARDGSKSIAWVYRQSQDANFEQAIADYEDIARQRGELTVVSAPKLPAPDANGQRPSGSYLITGVLADYDALRVAKVAIAIDVRQFTRRAGSIRTSHVSDPVTDADLTGFLHQIEVFTNGH